MIPRSRPHGTDWRTELRQAITEPGVLLEYLQLPRSRWLAGARQAAALFPLKVPYGFAARMRPADPHDPLLRQVLPLTDELLPTEGYTNDPVGDQAAASAPGLIRKYQGRALLITTGACAVHCRYCFRRHFPYAHNHIGGSNLSLALSAIENDLDLTEVILSGGDPLMMDDEQLARLVMKISRIKHIRRLRIHSRLPVVLPERISDSLLTIMASSRLTNTMVIHCNHPREIDDKVRQSLLAMQDSGIRLFNQSVLLRGVNDNPATLTALSETLFDSQVQPYYLHMLDRVHGSAHFDVPLDEAKSIYRALLSCLPGYLVPKLVREIEGMPSKTVISI